MSTPPHGTDATGRAPFPGTEDLDPALIFSGPGYTAPPLTTDPVCLAALVLALASVIPFVGLLAMPAGVWGLRRLRNSFSKGESMAWAGVVLGTASSVLWLWLWALTLQ